MWWLLPDDTKSRVWHHQLDPENGKIDPLDRLISRIGLTGNRRDAALGKVLTFDDDVAAALYSPTRAVPTYSKASSLTAAQLRNNYNGVTPDESMLKGWKLRVKGLASGQTVALTREQLLSQFSHHEMVTRLVCVEGWSGIASWGGFRFADFMTAYPPDPKAKWAQLISDVNLDSDGNADPYYVSIDLETARHPQSLLATHQDGVPVTLDHGAPLRLVVPMKLGLKNIKAITQIVYSETQPKDYWNDRGYSKYDGI